MNDPLRPFIKCPFCGDYGIPPKDVDHYYSICICRRFYVGIGWPYNNNDIVEYISLHWYDNIEAATSKSLFPNIALYIYADGNWVLYHGGVLAASRGDDIRNDAFNIFDLTNIESVKATVDAFLFYQ